MDDENQITAHELHLLDVIKQHLEISDDWQHAEHIFSALEFIAFIRQLVLVPVDEHRFVHLMDSIDFIPALNENNHKYYYLLNSL